MVAAADLPFMSPSEYLHWEAEQNHRHEYINGEICAMTGGTLAHNSITLNLAAALKAHLRGKPCKVFMADAKLQINETVYVYPDVAVTCDRRDLEATQQIQHPKLIIEVLSPGTEAKDRGRKFYHYRRLPSLLEYCLVTPDAQQVECYRLNDRGKWELTTYSADETDTLTLTTVGLDCPFSRVYEDVVLPTDDVTL
ncbi:Uma2 family endonuclease [Spirulina major CS-329]|uniref:Uma2 family endonuclease n=1 Tax=Spirulina TaxID=1154 RepID=UPI00232BBD8F|nr:MULTISPECIES: Uma2 family endonuclease [Spirulina]MDB9496568.1 Uma2 family endonuclease [Spirulina subsalsa CS-330]MDB9502476.1 Uma2 family endonuclease [Spirulina major CS-329]